MAKKLVTSYTFTPGVSGVGTVVIAGTYALEQFLLITNVADNIVIYEFDVNTLGGTVTTGGGNTTLTLTYNTSGMSSGDRLQVFIDDATNLNTSALALESGGNLASINTKVPTLSLGAQASSAAVTTVGANKTTVTGTASIAALNTDLITGAVSGWYDAAAFCTLGVSFYGGAGITAGQLQFESTNDITNAPNGTTQAYYNAGIGLAGTGPFGVGANTQAHFFLTLGHRYIRCRVTTAFAGGTVGATFTFGQQPVQYVSGNTQPVDLRNVSGQSLAQSQVNGSTSVGLGVILVAGNSIVDYSAQNVAAVSGSLTTNASSANSPSWAFDINLTTFTAGSSTGLDLYLQESPDNGTTFYDIWQVEALTAAGRARIPAISISGRRRIRWVNRTGAATTATLTVTTTGTPAALPIQRQFFDRTSGVGSGTAVLNTNSAAYDIAGCKQISVIMQAGTSTTMGTFQVQMSLDGTNWYAASVATAIGAITANNTVIPVTSGMGGRFIRVTCTNAGTAQVINAIHIYATS